MNFLFQHLMSLHNSFIFHTYFSSPFIWSFFFLFINLNIQWDLFVSRLKIFFFISYVPILSACPFLYNIYSSFFKLLSHFHLYHFSFSHVSDLIFLLFFHFIFISIFNLIPSYTISSSINSHFLFFTWSNLQTLITFFLTFLSGSITQSLNPSRHHHPPFSKLWVKLLELYIYRK